MKDWAPLVCAGVDEGCLDWMFNDATQTNPCSHSHHDLLYKSKIKYKYIHVYTIRIRQKSHMKDICRKRYKPRYTQFILVEGCRTVDLLTSVFTEILFFVRS